MHFPFNFPSLTRLSLSGLSHHTRSLSSLSRVFISPPSTEQSHQQTHIFSPVLPFLHQQQQQPLVRNYTIAIPRGKKLKRIRSILAPRKTTADGENTSLLPFGKNRDVNV